MLVGIEVKVTKALAQGTSTRRRVNNREIDQLAISMVTTQTTRLAKHFSKMAYVSGTDILSPDVLNNIDAFLAEATESYRRSNKYSGEVDKIIYLRCKDPKAESLCNMIGLKNDPYASYIVLHVSESRTKFSAYPGALKAGEKESKTRYAPVIVND